LENAIQERQTIQAGKDDRTYTAVTAEDAEGITAQVIAPIICEGDAIGAVVVMSREPRAKFTDAELRLATTAAGFLGRQMEN
jgi:AbrB family transcriptional regulator (stage V sporulation protein T)